MGKLTNEQKDWLSKFLDRVWIVAILIILIFCLYAGYNLDIDRYYKISQPDETGFSSIDKTFYTKKYKEKDGCVYFETFEGDKKVICGKYKIVRW